MNIERFAKSDGTALDEAELRAAAESDETIYFLELPISANSVLLAYEGGQRLQFSAMAESPGAVSFHEVTHDKGAWRFGIAQISAGSSSPSSVEVAVAEYLLCCDESELGDDFVVFSESNAPEEITACVLGGLRSSRQNHFKLRADSMYILPEKVDAQRAIRFINNYHEAPSIKYEYLEIYRSLESAFLSTIISDLNYSF